MVKRVFSEEIVMIRKLIVYVLFLAAMLIFTGCKEEKNSPEGADVRVVGYY